MSGVKVKNFDEKILKYEFELVEALLVQGFVGISSTWDGESDFSVEPVHHEIHGKAQSILLLKRVIDTVLEESYIKETKEVVYKEANGFSVN